MVRRPGSRIAAGAALLALTVACSAEQEPSAQPPASTTSAAPTTDAATPTEAPATTTGNQVISVTVAGGKVSPEPAPVEAKLGSTVVIEVTTDAADELHVHGYDKTLALPAGAPARLELPLTIPGQFEVELHKDGLLLFTLRVS